MHILITGAFGQVGTNILKKLVSTSHSVRCFDLKNKQTKKIARKFRNRFEVFWGDIRIINDVEKSMKGQDLVIHLAYILPPKSETDLELANSVNIGGTKNVIEVAKKQPKPPTIFYSSSFAIYGDVRDKPQPITTEEPMKPYDNYSQQKVACMNMLQESGLNYIIFVLAVIPPLNKLMRNSQMFEIPIDTKVETLHEEDVGTAFVNAIGNNNLSKKIYHIGGGPSCRLNYLDFLQRSMKIMGIGELPVKAFGGSLYHFCYINSEESNAILHYQNHSFEDILSDMRRNNRIIVFIIKLLRPLIRKMLLKDSPYI